MTRNSRELSEKEITPYGVSSERLELLWSRGGGFASNIR